MIYSATIIVGRVILTFTVGPLGPPNALGESVEALMAAFLATLLLWISAALDLPLRSLLAFWCFHLLGQVTGAIGLSWYTDDGVPASFLMFLEDTALKGGALSLPLLVNRAVSPLLSRLRTVIQPTPTLKQGST